MLSNFAREPASWAASPRALFLAPCHFANFLKYYARIYAVIPITIWNSWISKHIAWNATLNWTQTKSGIWSLSSNLFYSAYNVWKQWTYILMTGTKSSDLYDYITYYVYSNCFFFFQVSGIYVVQYSYFDEIN